MTGGQDADVESALVRTVSGRVGRFLTDTRWSGAGRLVFDVVVTAGWALSDVAKEEVAQSLEDLRVEWPHSLPRVRFTADHAMADHAYTVDVLLISGEEPREATAEAQDADTTDPEDPEADLMVLDMRYRRFRFVHRFSPADGWVPLSRGTATAGFRFPPDAVAIPQAPLVELRNIDGMLAVRRTDGERRYVVSVNGTRVPPGDRRGIRTKPAGTFTIREATGGAVAEIGYELHDRFAELRSDGASDPGDGAEIDAWIVARTFTQHLRIAAPAADPRADLRAFPVTDKDNRRRRLSVRVVYTAATSGDNADQRWHVKMYRCETPQDATALRRHLSRQAINIEQANTAAGGSNRRPPWVIAPVHILSLSRPERTPDTNLADTGTALAEGVDARLGGWFGAPDQPQADSCVLVASPMLQHNPWPDSAFREEAPGVSTLSRLAVLAKGLDECHTLGFAHGDIKSDNVCRIIDPNQKQGYVLIDGDSILPATCDPEDTRLTEPYVSAAVRRQRAAGRPVDLRGHDRWCFALVVIAAVAGPERMVGLLAEVDDKRIVDDRDRLTDALVNGWPPRWEAFATELAAPFGPDVVADPAWSLAGWVEDLRALSDPEPPCGHDECPMDGCARGEHGDEDYEDPYGPRLRAIRDAVRSDNLLSEDLRTRVIVLLRTQQLKVGLAEYRHEFVRTAAWVLVPVLILFLSVLIGARQ